MNIISQTIIPRFEETIFKQELQNWVDDSINHDNQENCKHVYEKIEACFNNMLETINLTFFKLKNLPDSLGSLVSLEHIFLSNNLIRYLPDSLGKLTRLKTINIYNNKLTTLPEAIGLLVNLENLNISRNQLQDLPSQLKNLSFLKTLNIEYNNFKSFPMVLLSLKALRTLYLHSNDIQTIPNEISLLINLETLDLNKTKIQCLPYTIGHLEKIRFLNLGENQLKDLPNSIEKLVNLHIFYLQDNLFREFPKGISKLQSLQILNMSNNFIKKIPDEIGELINLKDLSFFQNDVLEISSSIGKLILLEKLSFARNHLLNIPVTIGNLINLKEFYLCNNKLNGLPNSIGGLVNLYILNLDHNHLHYLPETIGNIENLRELHLDFNEYLQFLPLSLGNCKDLEIIEYSHTRISESHIEALRTRMAEIRRSSGILQLPARLASWLSYGAVAYNFNFLNEEGDFNPIQKGMISEWLNRLEQCQDFRNKRQDLARLVCTILARLCPTHPNFSSLFKDSFFAKIANNLEECGDRASMLLNMIFTDFILYTSGQGITIKERMYHLIGVAKTITLRKILANIIDENEKKMNVKIHEIVEIYLFYESDLKDRLGLFTAIDNMQYHNYGRRPNMINPDMLIESVENSYQNELSEFDDVKIILKEYPGFLQAQEVIENEMTAEMNKLDEKVWDRDLDYKEACDALVKKKSSAIANLVKDYSNRIIS